MKFFMKVLILLFSLLFASNAFASEDITGKWQGKLVPAPGSELVIDFIITRADDGTYSVVLNSPDQGAIKDIKAGSVVYDSGRLTMDVPDLSGAYEGNYKDGKFKGNWKQEGTSLPLNLSPYKKPVLSVEARELLLGQWYGPMTVTLTAVIQFEMTDGKFTGYLNIPERGDRKIPIDDVVLDGDNFSFVLTANGGMPYKGKLANNEIVGTLFQKNQPVRITLKKGKYVAPNYALKLPKETMDKLSGEWHGQLKMPANMMHIKFEFKTSKKGEFVGFYGAPENKIKNIPVTEAKLKDGKLALKLKLANCEFKGEIKGDKYTGVWSQAGLSPITLTMKKGEYVPPVYKLDLPGEARDLLSGEWIGESSNTAAATLVLRFKNTKEGDFVGFVDSPDAGTSSIPITEIEFKDNNITAQVPHIGGAFKGKFADNALTGVWREGTMPTEVTFKKGKFVPRVYSLKLPEETMNTLSGKWKGKLGGLELQLRFEKNEKGDFVGFAAIPRQKIKGAPISEATFNDGYLTLKLKLGNIRIEGQLKNNLFTANWVQGVNKTPLPLKKE